MGGGLWGGASGRYLQTPPDPMIGGREDGWRGRRLRRAYEAGYHCGGLESLEREAHVRGWMVSQVGAGEALGAVGSSARREGEDGENT